MKGYKVEHGVGIFKLLLPYTKSAALFPPSLLCRLGLFSISLQIP